MLSNDENKNQDCKTVQRMDRCEEVRVVCTSAEFVKASHEVMKRINERALTIETNSNK
jgi:hypothetical protein